jgi:cytochrome c
MALIVAAFFAAWPGPAPAWSGTSPEESPWLADPDSLVPDNDIEFHVPKPDERAAIIRFLKAASGK